MYVCVCVGVCISECVGLCKEWPEENCDNQGNAAGNIDNNSSSGTLFNAHLLHLCLSQLRGFFLGEDGFTWIKTGSRGSCMPSTPHIQLTAFFQHGTTFASASPSAIHSSFSSSLTMVTFGASNSGSKGQWRSVKMRRLVYMKWEDKVGELNKSKHMLLPNDNCYIERDSHSAVEAVVSQVWPQRWSQMTWRRGELRSGGSASWQGSEVDYC